MARGKMATLGYMHRFKESMSANAEKLKAYEETRLKFEGLLTQAQGLTQQQAALTAAKQESSKQLQNVLSEVQRVATVLRFAVRELYGKDAEKLVEFGLQPFRGRPRKHKEPEKPQPEPPAPPAQLDNLLRHPPGGAERAPFVPESSYQNLYVGAGLLPAREGSPPRR